MGVCVKGEGMSNCKNHHEVKLAIHPMYEIHLVSEDAMRDHPGFANAPAKVLTEIVNRPEVVGVDGLAFLRDAFADQWELRLRSWLVGTDKEVEEHTYPRTWWDAVKLRWFPAWTRKWLPVDMVRVRMERYCVYPEIPRPSGATYVGVPVLERRDQAWTDRGEE